MIKVRESLARWDVREMLGVAARENNSKRGYLLVNRLQGKHVPVAPGEALELFHALGERLYPDLYGGRVAFVGFAETATAIGAQIAVSYPGEGWYLQTTREPMPRQYAVVDFQEEHSHATEQLLFCRDREILTGADSIVFVEDEITTGKTILNFVDALERQGIRGRFAAASLINSMEPAHLERFRQRGIPVYYLYGLHNTFEDLALDDHAPENADNTGEMPEGVPVIPVEGKCDPRIGVPAAQYLERCGALADAARKHINAKAGERILVLGTEECMYPAIFCGRALEQAGHTVRTHATTRSPILVGGKKNPLQTRVRLESLYQAGRKTHLYNLEAYDRVLVVTDAEPIHKNGLHDLVAALRQAGNNAIQVIRWVE